MGYKESKRNFVSMDLSEMRPDGFLETILSRQKTNIETINDKNGWKARENCPVCQSDNKKYEFEKYGFMLFQCQECETAFFDKIPVDTNDIYSAPHAIEDAKQAYLTNKDYRKVRFASERVQLIEEFLGVNIHNKSILDVGCGTGWFLEVAKDHGANCFGVELGSELAKYTAKRLEIPIWNCELNDVETNNQFDVITMFDLIEHVVDPVSLITDAKKLLKDNGIILIFTPHFDSVSIQTMKEQSNLIMPAEHLSYFTKKTVEKIANLTELKLDYFVTKGIDLGDLKGFYEYNNQSQLAEATNNLYDIIQPVIDAAGSGNHLRAILRKED